MISQSLGQHTVGHGEVNLWDQGSKPDSVSARHERHMMVLSSVSGRRLKGQCDACSEAEHHTGDKGEDRGHNKQNINNTLAL